MKKDLHHLQKSIQTLKPNPNLTGHPREKEWVIKQGSLKVIQDNPKFEKK